MKRTTISQPDASAGSDSHDAAFVRFLGNRMAATPAARERAEQPPADGAREHSEPTTCHMYPGLCVQQDGEDGDSVDENGRHVDHGGRTYSVPCPETPDDPQIWAEFVHLSTSTPHIGFMGESLTPGQTYEKAAQLRRFADELDHLADQVHVARALANLRRARETASEPFAQVLTIVEKAIVEDEADPADVWDEVLTLLQQARDKARS